MPDMAKTLYLCHPCSQLFREAYILEELAPLPGIPTAPPKKPCERCRRQVYGNYYRLKKKGS